MLPHYYSVNEFIKDKYGIKMYKLALNGGMSCPNRDGLIDTRGCIFCSAGGSGDFAGGRFSFDSSISISDAILQQFESAKSLISSKYSGNSYIAYFQSFTNTYADVEYLRSIFYPIINLPEVKILSIATRPDCLSEETLSLLDELNRIKPVWIELGLQTIHPKTAEYIRRGYSLNVFEMAVSKLNRIGIKPIVHMIVGLPNETPDDILATADYIAHCNVSGVKLQLLHVLEGTDLYIDYQKGLFKTLELNEYINIIADIIQILPKDMVIHRITGDGPKDILVAPTWSSNKKNVLNTMNNYFKTHNILQGKYYK